MNVDDTLQQFTQLQFDAKPRFVGDTDYKLSNFTQIDRIDESRWFGIDDLDQDAYFKAEVVGTFNRDTIIGEVYTLPFIADKLVAPNLGAGFEPINATTVRATDTTMSVVGYGPATPRYNPIKLFNYVANELIEEIPLWHPAFGQHTPTALEGLNIISTQNPAKYNFSTQVVSNNSYDPLRPWGSNEIGRVWFDTRNLEYVPYWDSVIFTNRTERLSRWGALADFATIDVYEWVKSTVPPSEYNALALAQAGDADLDAATRAAGEVAGQETYVRDRIWSIRPVAWSYSGVPVAGAHPSFNASAGVFDTKLDLSGNGLAVLSAGTFASYGITAGMRIGAFDNSTIAPKPMSESIISSNFTKKIVVGGSPNTQVSVSGFDVKVEVEGYAPGLAGQIAFTAPLTSPIQQIDVSGNATEAYTVTPALTVSEINGDLLETVNIADVVGYLNPLSVPAIAPVAGQPYIAAIAAQEFRPARAEVPYIAPVVGQDFVPPTAGQAGYQIVRFNRAKASSDTTGLANTATVFTATVAFDNQAPIALSVVGSAAQTFAQLLESLNTQVPHRPFAISEDGDILVTSSTIGAQSKVSIVSSGATGIFNSLLNFDSIESPVLGIAENPGQPYIADFVGQAFVQADPGQPYVAEVIGQPYIAAVAGQAAVPGTYLAGATVDVIAGSPLSFSISSFGLKITVTPTQTATLPADAVRNAIIDALGTQVSVRDAVVISDVVSVPPEVPNASALSNDPLDQTDPLVAMYGWAAWNVPTQLQLTNDGRQPNSAWKPYLGDLAVQGQIDIAQVTDAVAYSAAPLTLNDGTIVNRYSTTWTDWSVLKNTVLRKTQVTSGALTLTLDDDYVGDAPSFSNIDSAITSVYVNGITQLKANFDIAGGSLTINENSVAFGSNATVIIRKYEPSAEELAFDPDVADNLTFQQQYKQDYEYVSLPVRDSEGSLSSTIYYFWVKNKTTSAFGKKLSIQSMAQELRDGPSNFLTFQTPTSGMLGSGVTSDPYRYDAIAISGLSYVVSKDDTFKLRFTRNFTLRDDPQQIDLKDTHAEWSLLRPGQRTKIPEALWQKLIDSVAGQDLAGNAVPALRRSLYDERNGTASQFGFGSEQTLAPKDLLVSSITYTIVNTKLIDTTIPIPGPDFISFLNFDESDTWFATPQAARQTMTDIWTTAKPSQINEIFFAALNDILASNYELSDVFKTSRLSAYSIKVVATAPVQPAYE